MAIAQPPPGSPTTLRAGTSTPSKKTGELTRAVRGDDLAALHAGGIHRHYVVSVRACRNAVAVFRERYGCRGTGVNLRQHGETSRLRAQSEKEHHHGRPPTRDPRWHRHRWHRRARTTRRHRGGRRADL